MRLDAPCFFAGEMLYVAAAFVDKNFHPTVICRVSCGEFPGISPPENSKRFDKSNSFDTQGTSVEGPTIIYVPTRKETLKIAEYLCRSGVKAAAYHAKLTKSHLRHVHDGFQQGSVQIYTNME